MTDAGTEYYHKDHQGSTNAVSDENGTVVDTAEYLPYGPDRSANALLNHSAYKYTDQEQDTGTGLYNYDARLYDPVLGQFVMADTIVPDLYDPQSLNRYAYCLNNPIRHVDPTGYIQDSWGGGGYSDSDGSSDIGGGYGACYSSGNDRNTTEHQNFFNQMMQDVHDHKLEKEILDIPDVNVREVAKDQYRSGNLEFSEEGLEANDDGRYFFEGFIDEDGIITERIKNHIHIDPNAPDRALPGIIGHEIRHSLNMAPGKEYDPDKQHREIEPYETQNRINEALGNNDLVIENVPEFVKERY